MGNPVGLAVTFRVRFGAQDAYQASGLVDPSRLLAVFGDVAAELMIRLDGDEGMMRGYQQVDLLSPIFVGDFIEATGVITKIGGTSRQIAFEARKIISHLRGTNAAITAADALVEPVIVCRAMGTCIVARQQQRHPRLVLPALPSGASTQQDSGRLPEGRVVVTPPPHAVITPPRETPPEVMIAASITGGGVTRDHTPHIPVTAEEIAKEAKRCRDAGASVVYLGFDSAGQTAQEVEQRLREAVQAIHAETDVVVFASTTSPGESSVAARLVPADCGVDLVGMATGTFNYGDVSVHTPRDVVRTIATSLRDRGIASIAECFDVGHIDEMIGLARDKLISAPLRFQVVLGVPGVLAATDDSVKFVVSRMTRGMVLFVAGVGRHQRRMTEAAMRMGGNVRVGLGDNIYLRKGVLAESSAMFVERSATFARSIGRQPVEPLRAKELLGLTETQAHASLPPMMTEGGDEERASMPPAAEVSASSTEHEASEA